jgi:hypothetical protein
MSDLRRPLAALDDDELGVELRSLAAWLDGPTVAVPAGGADPARRARLRIEAAGGRMGRRWWPLDGKRARPVRRSLVLAIVALVVLAAIVGAIGFGVPGIRIIFTGATAAPSASPAQSASPAPSATPISATSAVAPTPPGPPGADLDLGFLTTPAEAPTLTDFGLLRPSDPAVGVPDTIWYREGRLTLIWTSRPGLPDTQASGIGLLLTEFRGSVDQEFFGKMVGPGTTLTPVTVGGSTGYWIAGALHDFFYLDANGQVVNDGRRVVGDTLIWTKGTMTFRLETSLGRAAAIRIAETIR